MPTPVVFVDTNVLVYLRDSRDEEKQRGAAAWMVRLWESRTGRVSAQVLQEYYVTVTAKLDPGLPVADAREDVLALTAWHPLEPTLGSSNRPGTSRTAGGSPSGTASSWRLPGRRGVKSCSPRISPTISGWMGFGW